ncbi:hypothetical protein [Weissella soli]|uniref:Uncharacterized protein n=1 Tax=Weissella soli TaxID=155866 RepID=A0A288Q9L2_9LACO|nr:hypothetical protein [Weissella soli]AOT56580.1 hypothetical protein WSWS_00949 [Weissella soli]NKY83033.1 hypothetical protein [Weissella soli]RDL12146.1 hypothetical protein DFP99_0578 [Weissella soli]GEN92618.1 hypothetical protein WSO01_02300 [Weissella soli]
MKQIRIKDEMTIAQIELEIAKAKKHDDLPTLVRFSPNKSKLLTQNGIKFRQVESNDYDDLFRVYE